MRKERLKLGILMDALLVANKEPEKRHHIPNIRNKIAHRLQAVGLSDEEIEDFLRTIQRWIDRIIDKEVEP
jgi:hypothetical protein